jgi:putative ABC transport system permease protein
MARLGLAMLFHDKVKLVGTLFGVIFAVVLADEQAGTFLGLLYKNAMFIERSAADLWIVPQGVETFGPGQDLATSNATMAKGVAGVAWAEPLLVSTGNLQLPEGGTQQVTLIGSKYPYEAGGPWGVVRGNLGALRLPGTVLVEDGDRDNLGRLDFGSVRELNGRRVTVGGFTWGLIPFGPSYAFADYDLAREITSVAEDRANFVMVKVKPGADVARVAAALKRHVDDARVLTTRDFERVVWRHVLIKTAAGATLGTSTLFGLVVGFIIVALSMFSAVVDNIREFGTLKAVGSTNLDLMILLFAQAVTVALLGSVLGLATVSEIAVLIRGPRLAVLLPPWLMFGSAAIMVVLCVVASCLALQRLRNVEPAMVFR